ncbi:protein kinase, partial [Apiospora marii]
RTAISDTLGDWMIPTGRHVRGSGDEIWRRPEGGKLGEGTYGDVWMEICDSGPPEKARVRAVKVIPQKHLGLTQRELEAMIKCATSSNHPYSKYRHYLVEFMGWFQVQSSTVIAMEFVSHGSLQPYISMGRFSAPEVASITVQIARALQLIHGSNIAHRDLKPLNILVAQTGPSWWIKVADFGIAKSNQGTNLKTHRMGTSQYMAPEVLGADGIDDQAYSTAVDIWSLGAIIFCLFTGAPPFRSEFETYSYAIGHRVFPKVDPTSHLARREVMDVVSATMAKTPSERPSAGQVLDYYWLQPFASFVDRMFVRLVQGPTWLNSLSQCVKIQLTNWWKL